MKVSIRNLLALLLASGLWGCSQESRLVSKANGPHELMARWKLDVHGLSGGAPNHFDIQVWEKGSTFRAHVNSTIPSMDGPSKEQCDILCDGKSIWEFNHRYEGSDEVTPPTQYTIADPNKVRWIYFWRLPEVPFTKEGEKAVQGRDCVHLKTVTQDVTRATIEMHCFVDPKLGYLMKRSNSNAGETYGGQLECLEVQASPSFPAGHFDPPANAQASESPPGLWGMGIGL